MLNIKIKGGTLTGEKSLCETCSMAAVIRGQNNEEVRLCAVFGTGIGYSRGQIPFKVAECDM